MIFHFVLYNCAKIGLIVLFFGACFMSCKTIDTSLKFQEEGNSLIIEIITELHTYSTFKLEFHRAQDRLFGPECVEDESPFWEEVPVTHETKDYGNGSLTVYQTQLNGFVYKGIYCSKVWPYRLKTGEIDEQKTLYDIKNVTIAQNTTERPNCDNWTFPLLTLLNKDRKEKSLNVTFEVIPRACLLGMKSFHMNLKSIKVGFDAYSCENRSIIDDAHQSKKTFERLHKILAQSSACSLNNCDRIYSNVATLQDLQDDKPNYELGPERIELYYVVPLSVSVVLLVLAMACFFHWKKKKCYDLEEPEPLNVDSLKIEAQRRAENLEVILLHCRDFDEHGDAVKVFKELLSITWKVKNVRFPLDEESCVAIDLPLWVKEVTTVNRDLPNRRLIIVESEGAVLLEEGLRRYQVLRQTNEDHLDAVFPYALQLLKAQIEVAYDYRTIFVMKFPYTAEEHKLQSIVPNRRYQLPEGLFDLYLDMLDLRMLIPSLDALNLFKEEMTRLWNDSSSQDFDDKLKVASECLVENPNLVKELFGVIV